MIIAVVSQKGGVGKSSISRTLAVEYTRSGWDALLADVDASQITSKRWTKNRRDKSEIEPKIKTEVFKTTGQAIKAASSHDITIIDGAPHATSGTLAAAKAADLILIPSGSSMDDLEPSLILAEELSEDISKNKIIFIIYKVTSDAQEREAKDTISQYGYEVLESAIHVKTGYIEAFDSGYCATETKYKKLNDKAFQMIKEIGNKLNG